MCATASRGVIEPDVIPTTNLNLSVSPNPSLNNFVLKVNTASTEKISIRVIDILGRLVEQRANASGDIIRIGDNYKPGIYYVEVMQGNNRSVIKLIKSKPGEILGAFEIVQH